MSARPRAADVMDRAEAGTPSLEAEVESVRREARRRFARFVLDVTNPGTHFRNRACVPLDNDVFTRAGDLGLFRFSLPERAGGDGRDKLAWGVVVEEIAYQSRDPGFAVLLDITVEITELILSSGRPELIERYVPDLIAGRRFGVQGAYESRDPYDYRSTARFDGDAWVLNGVKRFVAGAQFANLFVLFLRDEASNDMLAFAVEPDDPGVTPVHMETMGLRTMGLGQVILHDVRLPEWRLVWRADALSELNTYARIRRTMSACGVLGALDGVIETCVESLSARRRGGRRVLDYPNVERSIGEARMLLQAARASVYRALDGTRAPDRDPYFDEFATVAKYHASECALRAGELVMNLQGGESYMTAFPWERFVRDIMGLIGGQGSQELLLIQLGQRAIVGLEGTRVREEAAERTVAKLADAWWTLHAATATGDDAGVLAAAGLGEVTPDDRTALAALLDRAHAAVASVQSGQFPHGPAGLFGGRLAEVAAGAWGFLSVAVAHETGLLARLLEPSTPDDIDKDLLETLVDASVVRRDGAGRYAVDQGLERVLIGGPRATAFAARLARALAGGAALRSGVPLGRALVPGCGGDAAVLADVLVNSLLGRLEGLPGLLDRPGARVGCAAGDGGRSAAELARHIPFVPVSDVDGFDGGDGFALAWLPAGGLTGDDLGRAVHAAAQALVPGGWLVLPCPLPPKRPLGAAVMRLTVAVAGGAVPADGAIEGLLRSAGLGHVREVWSDGALGVRLVAARRP